MAEFTDPQKLDIVRQLAQFVPPSKIVAELRKDGVSTDARQIGSYDPTRSYFEAGDRWRDIFLDTRKKFIEDLDSIPSANKAFRINLLHEAALKARNSGASALMASLLKQIAEDTGGSLTNERNVNLTSGDVLTQDERRIAAARLFDQALGRDEVRKPAGTMVQ